MKINKNNMKKLECVILLRGNFVVVQCNEDKKEELTDMLHDCNKKASSGDPTVFVKWGDDVTILAKEIVGWYYRTPVESSTQQLMKFIEKKLPDVNEGDGWKGEI
jgi:hypothetical protein